MSNLEPPTPSEIHKFISIFSALDTFESAQRTIRGYGAFNEATVKTFPDPAVIKVLNYLSNLTTAAQELAKDGTVEVSFAIFHEQGFWVAQCLEIDRGTRCSSLPELKSILDLIFKIVYIEALNKFNSCKDKDHDLTIKHFLPELPMTLKEFYRERSMFIANGSINKDGILNIDMFVEQLGSKHTPQDFKDMTTSWLIQTVA